MVDFLKFNSAPGYTCSLNQKNIFEVLNFFVKKFRSFEYTLGPMLFAPHLNTTAAFFELRTFSHVC
jgi:hypothetical protein